MHKSGPVVLNSAQPSSESSGKQQHRHDETIDDDNVTKEDLSHGLITKPTKSSDKPQLLEPTLKIPTNICSLEDEPDRGKHGSSYSRIGTNSQMSNSSKEEAIESQPIQYSDANNILPENDSSVKTSPPQHKVKWMQSESLILVKIYVTNVKEFTCSVEDNGNKLKFSAITQVEQQETLQPYRLSLSLYLAVDADRFYCCKFNRYLSIELKKRPPSDIRWPRLTKSTHNIDWISECYYDSDTLDDGFSDVIQGDEDVDGLVFPDKRVAFEEIERQLRDALRGYNCSSNEQIKLLNKSSDQTKQNEQYQNVQASNKLIKIDYQNKKIPKKDIFNPFKKNLNRFRGQRLATNKCMIGGDCIDSMKYDYRQEHSNTMDVSKNTAKHALNCKKTYLFLYNLLMFVMFLMVHMILTIKELTGSMDDDSVQGAAFIIKLLTYTQLLESIHPMLGLVPGGPFMPLLQVIGRLLVNHFLTNPDIRLSSAPYAHYLFIVWSSIEIFRYSYYALRVFNVEIYPISWCRYTLFMPLYPIGGYCESQIVWATIKHYETSDEYSINLPNAANFSFVLPNFLRFYTYFLLGPSILYLMKYMWTQRRKQLKEKTA